MKADYEHTQKPPKTKESNQPIKKKRPKNSAPPNPTKTTKLVPKPEYLEYLNLRKTDSEVNNKLKIKSIK